MGLTVETITKQFQHLKYDDLKKLVGRSNFDDNTVISLNNIANYRGNYSTDISIFTAKSEGDTYLKLLGGKEQKKISEAAGVMPPKQPQMANNSNPIQKNNNIQQQTEPLAHNNNNNNNSNGNNNTNNKYKPLNLLA